MKIPIILFFDKKTRQFTGIVGLKETLDTSIENSLYREEYIEEKIFYEGSFSWKGSYDDGCLVIEEVFDVYERDINTACHSQIIKAYPLEEQLKIIIDQIASLPFPKTEEFLRMFHFIKETRNQNKRRKEEYKADDRYRFISFKEEIDRINKALDKGEAEKRNLHDIDRPFEIEDLL